MPDRLPPAAPSPPTDTGPPYIYPSELAQELRKTRELNRSLAQGTRFQDTPVVRHRRDLLVELRGIRTWTRNLTLVVVFLPVVWGILGLVVWLLLSPRFLQSLPGK